MIKRLILVGNLYVFFVGNSTLWFWTNCKKSRNLLYLHHILYTNIRQHCRLTICIELVELTNSIRWQDPNNNTDTETRCLVYATSQKSVQGVSARFWRTCHSRICKELPDWIPWQTGLCYELFCTNVSWQTGLYPEYILSYNKQQKKVYSVDRFSDFNLLWMRE